MTGTQIPGGLDPHRCLLARGCTLALDLWGDELQYGHVRMPTDVQRTQATAGNALRLIDRRGRATP